MKNNVLKNISNVELNCEYRNLIQNLYNYVNITPDIYLAFDTFINPEYLKSLLNDNDNDSSESLSMCLFKFYKKWLYSIASKEQREICLFYGILNVTHQIRDLKKTTSFNILEEYKSQILNKNKNKKDIFNIEISAFEDQLNEGLGIISNKPLNLNKMKPLIYENEEDSYRRVNILYKLSTKENLCWLSQFRFMVNSFNNFDTPLNTIFDNYLIFINEKLNIHRLKKNKEYLIKNTLVEKILDIKNNKIESFGKKSIKKALKLYENLFNDNDICLFLSGKEMLIEGDLFNYGISQSGISILEHTINPVNLHIPYKLIVLSKNNEPLCNACILFKETPIIDQIIAFKLHIKSGQENKFLETANFFNKEKLFYKQDYFKENEKYVNNDLNEELNNKFDKELKTYDELSYKIEESMDNNFFDFLSIKNLPEHIKELHYYWFDEMLENYKFQKREVKKCQVVQ